MSEPESIKKDWEEYAFLGKEKAEANEIEAAIVNYEKAIELGCDQEWVYIKLGGIYTKLGKNKLALESLEQAIALNQQNVWGYIGSAKVLREEGKFEEALEKCEIGLQYNPGNKDLELLQGEITQLLPEKTTGKWEEYASLAEEKREAGEIEAAIVNYEKAIELGCAQEWVYIRLGGIYNKLGKNKLALERLEQAIALNQQNVWGYIGAAKVLGEEGKFEEALRKCEVGLQDNPGNEDLELLKAEIIKILPENPTGERLAPKPELQKKIEVLKEEINHKYGGNVLEGLYCELALTQEKLEKLAVQVKIIENKINS
ncbi:MAG: hypothetical protein DSM107014_01715 [Gomphosphaeria aponina SAG 52.96 = DSM 107014]|uniref:TPR-like protein n=1 Tax=Gomphosphaeria aponina SAG 52.96 = DSM 107014 TaxID=1521640 RepID=A0A941JNS4_9CHRO|nr:hypothetical protein [Gomphosphaeria aponina SAG 52.96 = DSM 107014]